MTRDDLKASFIDALASGGVEAALDIVLKAAAEIADSFRCGACGMDGAASAAILALKESANDKG